MYTYKAKIVNVVDGDTVDAQVDLGFNIQANVRLRFAGINTAELRSNDPKAQEAKNLLLIIYSIRMCLSRQAKATNTVDG